MVGMRRKGSHTLKLRYTQAQLDSVLPGTLLREIHSGSGLYLPWAGRPREVVEIVRRIPGRVMFKYKCGNMVLGGSMSSHKPMDSWDMDYPIASRWIFASESIPLGCAEVRNQTRYSKMRERESEHV